MRTKNLKRAITLMLMLLLTMGMFTACKKEDKKSSASDKTAFEVIKEAKEIKSGTIEGSSDFDADGESGTISYEGSYCEDGFELTVSAKGIEGVDEGELLGIIGVDDMVYIDISNLKELAEEEGTSLDTLGITSDYIGIYVGDLLNGKDMRDAVSELGDLLINDYETALKDADVEFEDNGSNEFSLTIDNDNIGDISESLIDAVSDSSDKYVDIIVDLANNFDYKSILEYYFSYIESYVGMTQEELESQVDLYISQFTENTAAIKAYLTSSLDESTSSIDEYTSESDDTSVETTFSLDGKEGSRVYTITTKTTATIEDEESTAETTCTITEDDSVSINAPSDYVDVKVILDLYSSYSSVIDE